MSSQAGPVEFLPLGAIIQSFTVGGVNIALGYPSEEIYRKTGNKTFFGETIGRVANRISAAKIDSLNGKSYELEANEGGKNNLHGGSNGWGKATWEGPTPVNRNGREEVMFKHISKDGDAGFPGTVEAKVYYAVSKAKKGIEGVNLDWEYEIELVGDEVEETVVNVTNHGFWNLSGEETIAGTQCQLFTNLHQVVDDASLPTGEIAKFPGIKTGQGFNIGAKEPFIDHCFILQDDPKKVGIDTRGDEMRTAIHLVHGNGIHLEMSTTEPAFQVYTGEGINVPEINEGGHKVPARGPRSGLALEPSRYVNAINNPEWKHMVVLKKGQTWGSKTRFTTWKA